MATGRPIRDAGSLGPHPARSPADLPIPLPRVLPGPGGADGRSDSGADAPGSAPNPKPGLETHPALSGWLAQRALTGRCTPNPCGAPRVHLGRSARRDPRGAAKGPRFRGALRSIFGYVGFARRAAPPGLRSYAGVSGFEPARARPVGLAAARAPA